MDITSFEQDGGAGANNQYWRRTPLSGGFQMPLHGGFEMQTGGGIHANTQYDCQCPEWRVSLRVCLCRVNCVNLKATHHRKFQPFLFRHIPLKKSKKNRPIASLDHDSHGLVTLTSNPIWRAFSKKPVPEKTRVSVGLAARKALYGMSHGFGDFDQLGELVLAAHTGTVLAERGCGEEFLADFRAALARLADCRLRALSDGTYALLQEETIVISHMIDLYEQQIALVAQDELANAIVDGYRRSSHPI